MYSEDHDESHGRGTKFFAARYAVFPAVFTSSHHRSKVDFFLFAPPLDEYHLVVHGSFLYYFCIVFFAFFVE